MSGEWFLSREGWFLLKPRENEKMKTADILLLSVKSSS
jgi:hypothetical protein